ncbi:MAG: hypothetical protein P4L79_10255 [Legionella sp.]|uniref:hypothetical protein n=1 Tax=Legionella sp. TaxID=459 RepID=UPI00285045B1|nr:hypothetical protein [Legionella sp.]
MAWWNKKKTTFVEDFVRMDRASPPNEFVTPNVVLEEMQESDNMYSTWWKNNTRERKRRMTWEAFVDIQIGIMDEMVMKL